MADRLTREDVAKAMRDMDLCFMATHGEGGAISSRAMSNNAQVDWDGDNWFFSNGARRAGPRRDRPSCAGPPCPRRGDR